MAWKFESGTPIYIQIAERIAFDILSGTFSPGDRLPTVRDIAMAASVNPNTVQKAIYELESSGLIVPQRGMGCYVTTDTEIIKSESRKTIMRLTGEYLSKLSSLGYSKDDAAEMIREFEKGGVSK